MATFSPIIELFEKSESVSEQTQIAEYLIQSIKQHKPSPEDVQELSQLAFRLIDDLLVKIPAAPTYKAKDELFNLEDKVLGLLLTLYGSPNKVPEEKMTLIRQLVKMIQEEQVLENAITKLFEQEEVYPAYVEQLINIHRALTDEFQKSQLYTGTVHYAQQGKLAAFSDECKEILGNYVATEAARYLAAPGDEQVLVNLELIADVAVYFPTDALVEQVYAVLPLGHANINYYAVATLVKLGKDVPADAVAKLAENLTYANLTYHALKDHGKESVFPAEYADEVYLAKSDLVHWLTYPTELGKEPDEIEYLGKVKVKKENFWIFRYKSDSDTLSEDLQNQWLIGWSGDDGGTFSQFDLYAPFEKKTPEKTVKYIKKKLL
ncbi:MAG: hypothetical protein IJW98_00705 [Clostridia bacterium]|nr:hypothetical protein [Clostridia bacterium]